MLALVGIYYIAPSFYSLYVALTEWNIASAGGPTWIGTGNFQLLLADAYFWQAAGNTLVYTAGVVLGANFLALAVSLLVFFTGVLGNTVRTLCFLPYLMPTAIIGFVWVFMLDERRGVINMALDAIGVPSIGWLTDPDAAMTSVILAGIWKNFGFSVLVISVSLEGFPRNVLDAARIDGAPAIETARRLVIPYLLPVLTFCMIVVTIFSFQVFAQVYVMTRGGPNFSTTTLMHYLYLVAFEQFRMGYASAIAVAITVVVLLLTAVQLVAMRRRTP